MYDVIDSVIFIYIFILIYHENFLKIYFVLTFISLFFIYTINFAYSVYIISMLFADIDKLCELYVIQPSTYIYLYLSTYLSHRIYMSRLFWKQCKSIFCFDIKGFTFQFTKKIPYYRFFRNWTYTIFKINALIYNISKKCVKIIQTE